MTTFEYSDRLHNRNREPRLFFVNGIEIIPFYGKSIPGVCRIEKSNYSKGGKWSGTDWTLSVPDSIIPIKVIRPFNGWGECWNSITEETWNPVNDLVVDLQTKIRVVRECSRLNPDWENLAASIIEADKSLATFDEPAPAKVIVTRHAGLVTWLEKKGITGEVIAQASPADVKDKIVYGVLPLHLAALAAEVWTVDMPNLPLDKRGQDITPTEMDNFGATLTGYRVSKI